MINDGIFILVAPIFSDLANLAFSLRREVFVLEQNVSEAEEFDDKDLESRHIVVIASGHVAATLRITFSEQHAQISRFAVKKNLRNRGIGRKTLKFSIDHITKSGEKRIYLAAQIDKLKFYHKFGFIDYGDEFLDAGILHKKMKNY